MCARFSTIYPKFPEGLLMSNSWSYCKNHYCFQVNPGTVPCQPWIPLPELQDFSLLDYQLVWEDGDLAASDLLSLYGMTCPRSPQAVRRVQLELLTPVWSDTRAWLKWSHNEQLERSGALRSCCRWKPQGRAGPFLCLNVLLQLYEPQTLL